MTENLDKLRTVVKALRQKIKDMLASQQRENRLEKSDLIKERLFADEDFIGAGVVMFYVSTDEEVNTIAMMQESLAMGKKVAVPVTSVRDKKMVVSLIEDLENDLKTGPYGILQPEGSSIRPIDPTELDLVVVPGVVFDRAGNRIGRGAGYYDRFLSVLPKDTPVIGLAFDFQVVEELPVLPHDVPMKKVISA